MTRVADVDIVEHNRAVEKFHASLLSMRGKFLKVRKMARFPFPTLPLLGS